MQQEKGQIFPEIAWQVIILKVNSALGPRGGCVQYALR